MVIILLPIPVVVQLHLPRRTKGGLCAIFAVGVLYVLLLSFLLFLLDGVHSFYCTFGGGVDIDVLTRQVSA